MGDPAALSRPKDAGAQPVRAREKSMRDDTYKAALAPDRAAVSTTKVIMCDAAGMRAWRNTVTNGLSVTPARFHGITPTNTTMAPMCTTVSTEDVIHAAFATSLADRDSP